MKGWDDNILHLGNGERLQCVAGIDEVVEHIKYAWNEETYDGHYYNWETVVGFIIKTSSTLLAWFHIILRRILCWSSTWVLSNVVYKWNNLLLFASHEQSNISILELRQFGNTTNSDCRKVWFPKRSWLWVWIHSLLQ